MNAIKPFLAFHTDERGLFSLTNLAFTFFLTVAAVCALNMGTESTDRAAQQRKTDAIAESLGTWKARNLNAVVSQQHLIGELLGIAVVHHALGGDLLDNREAADTAEVDRQLKAAYEAARFCETGTPAYSDTSKRVFAGEALLKAYIDLKELLTKIYWTKAVAFAMQKFPPTQPAGHSLEKAAHQLELLLHEEWKTVHSVQEQAEQLSSLKQQILHQFLPDAKRQLDQLIANYPRHSRALPRNWPIN